MDQFVEKLQENDTEKSLPIQSLQWQLIMGNKNYKNYAPIHHQ